jgi:hypothetical protein
MGKEIIRRLRRSFKINEIEIRRRRKISLRSSFEIKIIRGRS